MQQSAPFSVVRARRLSANRPLKDGHESCSKACCKYGLATCPRRPSLFITCGIRHLESPATSGRDCKEKNDETTTAHQCFALHVSIMGKRAGAEQHHCAEAARALRQQTRPREACRDAGQLRPASAKWRKGQRLPDPERAGEYGVPGLQ